MKDEYDLEKMRKRKSKVVKAPKVVKTIRFDIDVMEWLYEKSEEEGVGYQTFLNSFLKKSINMHPSLEALTKRVEALEKKVKKK